MIDIISATRLSPRDFWSKSALGQSLTQLMVRQSRIRVRIAFANRKGLPEVYNSYITARDCSDALVFVHDDVWIEDTDFVKRVMEGLSIYEVIGVAGNRRRLSYQPAWAFEDFSLLNPVSREHLSGAIAHGEQSPGRRIVFGDWPQDCELLDGVFLAARRSSLRNRQVMFDPKFKFHFYDMDFCRSARLKELKMGTWPVNLTHQSRGAFGTPAWTDQYRLYLEKWGA